MEEVKIMIIVYGTLLVAITLSTFLYVIEIRNRLLKFGKWLRHNNPGGYVEITMGNGEKYRIKMDKEEE